MSGIEFADFSRRWPKVIDPNVGELQSREDVIAARACGRSLGQSLLMVATTTALSAQLLSKNRPKRARICAISHHHLHCRTKTEPASSPIKAAIAVHPWPPNPRGGERFSRYHHWEIKIAVRQRLAHGIALIVMPATGERE